MEEKSSMSSKDRGYTNCNTAQEEPNNKSSKHQDDTEKETRKVRSHFTKEYQTYMVIDPGTEQHMIGARRRIISKSEFSSINMGGTSNQMGSIDMYFATT